MRTPLHTHRSRAATRRLTALLVVVLFFQLELSALMGGRLQPAEARAEGPQRRVAVFVFPKGAGAIGDAQVLQTLVREEAGRLERIRVIGGAPVPARSAQTEAAELVETGLRALNARDHAAAETAYSEAYDRLSRHTGATHRRLWARTLKGLGVARVLAGNVRGGQDMMKASLNMWGDQLPAEYGFTLDVMNAFKEAQRLVAEEAAGRVAVITEPEGAEVSVGGKVRGYAPLTVSDLAPGLHWVQASLDGYVRSSGFVEVQPGADAAQRFALVPRDNTEAYQAVIDKLKRSFRSKKSAESVVPVLAQLVGADEALAVLVSTNRKGAYVFDGWYSQGPTVVQADTTIARDAQFLGNMQAWLAGTLAAKQDLSEESMTLDAPAGASVVASGSGDEDLFIDPNDPILKGAEGSAAPSITSEWWFWAVVGGVAAGVTTGAILLFSGTDEGTGPTGDLTIQLHQ